MIGARAAILARIRTALGPAAVSPVRAHSALPRDFHRVGELDAHARLELLIDRLVDYDTEILQIQSETQIAAAIAQTLEQHHETRAVAPAQFPPAWLPSSPAITLDHSLSPNSIEDAQAVITTCEVAIASTGTIILVHEGAQGRRLLTLLPDHHICILRRDQIVELVPEALARVAPRSRSPITTISGPSATSDIEMTRIRGVHGPRRLTVILYGALES